MHLKQSEQISDEELVKGLKVGKMDFHRLLIDKYAPKLRAYIYKIVGNQADADEILNDVFYRVIKNIHRYRPARAFFKTWTYTITTNRAYDFYRKEATRREKAKDYRLEMQAQGQLPSLANDTFTEESDTPQIKALKKVLDQLPHRDRTLLEMSCIARIPAKEIATQLGLKPGAVRVALYRARVRLKKKLATSPEFSSYF